MNSPIIIGAGHNGLTTAFYLAKAGLKPLVLERRAIVGGAAVTEELAPGYLCPTLAHATRPESLNGTVTLLRRPSPPAGAGRLSSSSAGTLLSATFPAWERRSTISRRPCWPSSWR